MWILLITFKSTLPMPEVLDLFEKRSDKFRAVNGLVQKFYFHDESCGQVGGMYVFDSKENLEAFRSSDLAKGIASAYKVIEPLTMKPLMVTKVLYEGRERLI